MRILLLSLFLATLQQTIAQEAHVPEGHAGHHGMKGAQRLTLGLGHTHISEGQVDGKTQWLVAGSWSINYDYWLSDKWAVGLQNDIILEDFKIEDAESEIIERKRPIAMVPVAIYKPGKHFSFVGGFGFEYASGKTLGLTRLGVEYGFHIPNNWEVGAALVWDNKWRYYNTWGMAFTFSKIWPGKHH